CHAHARRTNMSRLAAKEGCSRDGWVITCSGDAREHGTRPQLVRHALQNTLGVRHPSVHEGNGVPTSFSICRASRYQLSNRLKEFPMGQITHCTPPVTMIQQRNSATCWLASCRMMYMWKNPGYTPVFDEEDDPSLNNEPKDTVLRLLWN